MDPICSCGSQPTVQYNPKANQSRESFAQINQLMRAGERHTDITIITEEGDKVTLSSDVSIEVSLTTYNSMARTNRSYVDSKGMLFSFDVSREISVEIEGDLNDQEKKEIKEVVKTIFKMIKGFLTGKPEDGVNTAWNLNDLQEISIVQAEFQQSNTLTMLTHTVERNTAYSPLPAKEVPSDVDRGQSRGVDHPVDRLTDRMVEVVRDSRVKLDILLEHFDRMASWLSREFRQGDQMGWEKLGMIQTILKEFIEKLQEPSIESKEVGAKDSSEIPAVDSPTETVQSEQVSVLQLAAMNQISSFNFEYHADT